MFRSQNQLGSQALTLGVWVDTLGDPYLATLLRGICKAADSAGATLLVFAGGRLSQAAVSGEHCELVYDYAGPHILDGLLLLSSTLIHEVGVEGLEKYCQRIPSLPKLSLGIELSEMPSVTVDNKSGVGQLVDHLIEEHGARSIACIRGPLANAEAEARTQAYCEALTRHNLPVCEDLIVEADFTVEGGELATRELFALLGPKFKELDAIIANNDGMALGAMAVLGELGVSVPQRIAVAGFDNIDDAQLVQPPLATIAQPLERLGQQAVRGLLEFVQHGTAPDNVSLPTELVLRRSCGCVGVFASHRCSFSPPSSRSVQASLLLRYERIVLEMLRASCGGLGAAGVGWEKNLLHAFLGAIESSQAGTEEFLRDFQITAERVSTGGGDLNLLEQVMEVLRQQLVPLLREDAMKSERAADLFHLSRTVLNQVQQHRLSSSQVNLNRWSRTFALVCNSISGVYSHDALRDAIQTQLPILGVHSCFVATYPEPQDTQVAQLLVAFDSEFDGRAYEGKVFSARDLLPRGLAEAGHKGRSYSVHPLEREGVALGFLLLDLDSETLFLSSALSGAVAGALRGTQLLAAARGSTDA